MESNVMNLNLRMHSDRIGKERSRIWECQTAGIDSFVNTYPAHPPSEQELFRLQGMMRFPLLRYWGRT